MKSKILNVLMSFLFLGQIHLNPFIQNSIYEKILFYSTSNNLLTKEQVKAEDKELNEVASSDKEFNEVASSINFLKILFVVLGCVSTAVVSLISENLLNRIVVRVRDVIAEITDNQGLLNNISAEGILNISNHMKAIRVETKAIRISLFKLDKSNAVLFLESSLKSKYSLANSPPVARQFFDIAILPMTESGQDYSYCGNNGDICQTWLAQRGTGRHAIRLFSHKTFTGFILIEWKLSLMEKVFKNDNMLNNYREQLDLLASIIIDAIKDKK